MSRLENLIEQTSFLLQKQIEVKQECDKLFQDFLRFLQEQAESITDKPEEKESFERMHDMISGHAQRLSDEVQDDIEFLTDQLDALEEIKKVPDADKRKEMLATLIDEEDEVEETEAFKQSVEREAVASKSSLVAMIGDVKSALREGDTKEVELLLEAMIEEESKNMDMDIMFEPDDGEDDDDSGFDDAGGNGQGTSGGPGTDKGQSCSDDAQETSSLLEADEGQSCCGSGGCAPGGCGDCSLDCGPGAVSDIFSMLHGYDKELSMDMQETPHKK